MSEDAWEAAQLAGVLTTYIAGIEDTLKEPMVGSVAYLVGQVDGIYATLSPIVGEAMSRADVNLPWD